MAFSSGVLGIHNRKPEIGWVDAMRVFLRILIRKWNGHLVWQLVELYEVSTSGHTFQPIYAIKLGELVCG